MNIVNHNNVKYIITKDNKFKTTRISIKFALPMSKEIVANALVLNDLLVMSTKQYNTMRLFNEKLYDLYDLSVSSGVSQKGKLHVSEINFSFVNSEFLSTNIDDEVVDFIRNVIFNPNFDNKDYIKNVVDKRILEVQTIYDDKMMYCIKTLQEILDNSEERIVDVNSNEEDLKNVNVESLKDFYNKMLTQANITVLIDGRSSEGFESKLSTKLDFKSSSEAYEYLNRYSEKSSYNFVSQTQELNQSKFAVGIKLDIDKKDFMAFQIFNGIYGGFPFSRLFSNIREKQSLAYTVASAYIPSSNLMYVYGGISNGDLNESDEVHMQTILNALNAELNSIVSGDVSDLEMSQSKSMLLNSLKSSLDTQSANQALFYNSYLLNEDFDFNRLKNDIDSVKKEDVVRVAKSVVFDTVFLLRGDK